MKIAIGLLACSISFTLGQYAIIYAYNPRNLEDISLDFIQLAYENGCTLQGGKEQPCVVKATKYKKDIEEIFHNRIWEK